MSKEDAAAEEIAVLEEEGPSCRICLESGETAESGRLFSPCLCSGSSGHIHESCLAQWRRSNHSAFLRCGICHYEYRTSRQKYASIITNPWTITIASILVVVCSVAIVAYFLKFLCYLVLGASASRSVFALSGKLVWWAMAIIGIVTLIVCLLASDDRGDALGAVFRFIGEIGHEPVAVQYVGHGLSLTGFGLFCKGVYRGVRNVAQHWLEQLGDKVLGVHGV